MQLIHQFTTSHTSRGNNHAPETSQYLGDAGIVLDDAEQAGVGNVEAPEKAERPQRPLRPRSQLEEDLVGHPAAERRLYREATPQEGVPRDGLAEEAAYAPAG